MEKKIVAFLRCNYCTRWNNTASLCCCTIFLFKWMDASLVWRPYPYLPFFSIYDRKSKMLLLRWFQMMLWSFVQHGVVVFSILHWERKQQYWGEEWNLHAENFKFELIIENEHYILSQCLYSSANFEEVTALTCRVGESPQISPK